MCKRETIWSKAMNVVTFPHELVSLLFQYAHDGLDDLNLEHLDPTMANLKQVIVDCADWKDWGTIALLANPDVVLSIHLSPEDARFRCFTLYGDNSRVLEDPDVQLLHDEANQLCLDADTDDILRWG